MSYYMTHWLPPILALLIISGCGTTSRQPQYHETIDTLYEQINELPADRTWEEYHQMSDQVHTLDLAFIERESRQLGLEKPFEPPPAHHFGFDPRQPVSFYATAEGRRVADIIVSFQTPSGGWSKRTDMAKHPRRPGEAFGVEQHYIPTFDNHATSTQLWVLTKAYQATGERRYSDAVLRGLELILLAQYPNGGWPQTFPLIGGYHDHITYNDEVMTNLLQVVQAAGHGRSGMDFVPRDLQRHAQKSHERDIEAVLATQVIIDDKPTIWGAQHDPRSMLSTAARAFEPEALATAESARLVLSLMRIEEPSDALKQAISDAVAWFEDNQIHGYEWVEPVEGKSRLQPREGAGPLWARFVELGTNRPIFGDRDGEIHYDVDEIPRERQRGYAWYTSLPAEVLRVYEDWRDRHQQR